MRTFTALEGIDMLGFKILMGLGFRVLIVHVGLQSTEGVEGISSTSTGRNIAAISSNARSWFSSARHSNCSETRQVWDHKCGVGSSRLCVLSVSEGTWARRIGIVCYCI